MGHPGEPAGSRSQHFSPVSNNPLQIKLCAESRCKVSHRPVLKLHFQPVENRQKYILTCNKSAGRGSQNIQMALDKKDDNISLHTHNALLVIKFPPYSVTPI